MNTFEDIWRKLAKSKKYREEFALSLLKRSVPFQVKTLRKKHCGSQAVLAERAKLTQGVVSRAEDQDYGNLTFNTVGRIAAGLDMAFIGKFVPFSELVKFSLNLSEEEFATIPTFDEELNTSQAAVATTPIFANVTATERLPAAHAPLAGRASTGIVSANGIMPFTVRDFPPLGPLDMDIAHAQSYGSVRLLFQPAGAERRREYQLISFIPAIEEQEENRAYAR